MNTVDTALREKLRAIVTRNGMSARIPEMLELELDKLEALILSLTNEAELRGRQSELETLLGYRTGMTWATVKLLEDRLAALLKLKGGEEKHHD